MTVKSKLELTCDLCHYPAELVANSEDAKKKGWLTVGQEEYHTDRSFFDAHICPSCRKKIEALLKK